MIVLLIVTVTSMLLAAIMSAIAWRVSTDERRRSDARVAALAAEIHGARKDPAYNTVFAVVAAGVLVVAAAVSIAILGSGRSIGATRGVARTAAAATPAAQPLELLALGHERAGEQLTVRGIVRNPPAGASRDRLTAVVLLFTPEGGFLTSGRAAIEAPALRPGGESAFVVTVPRAGDVGRYRVSFTAGDRVVPHLDRRHES